MKGKNAYAYRGAPQRQRSEKGGGGEGGGGGERAGRGMRSWLREAPAAQARFSRRRGGWMGLTPCGDGGLCRSPAF